MTNALQNILGVSTNGNKMKAYYVKKKWIKGPAHEHMCVIITAQAGIVQFISGS